MPEVIEAKVALKQAVGEPVERGQLLAAGRTVHGTLWELGQRANHFDR